MFKAVEEVRDVDVEVHSGPYYPVYLAYCTLSKLVNTKDSIKLETENLLLFLIEIFIYF